MTDTVAGSTSPADRYDDIAAILTAYPDIPDDDLEALKQWFRKAGAFDVASLASNEAITPGYTQFRADHVDKFSSRDLLFLIVGLVLLAGIVGIIGLLAP